MATCQYGIIFARILFLISRLLGEMKENGIPMSMKRFLVFSQPRYLSQIIIILWPQICFVSQFYIFPHWKCQRVSFFKYLNDEDVLIIFFLRVCILLEKHNKCTRSDGLVKDAEFSMEFPRFTWIRVTGKCVGSAGSPSLALEDVLVL